MNGNAALETSARRDLGQQLARPRPGNRKAGELRAQRLDLDRAIAGQMLLEPAHVILLGDAGAGEEPAVAPRLASVKSPISLPSSFSIGASVMRPGFGSLQASIRSSQAAAPCAA